MVGKLPNCSQARRSRTEERKRLMDPTISPKSKPSYAPGIESQTLQARGWMSENQILLADRKKYFCLDIPFYRTLPTLFGNPFRIPTLPRPRRRVRCLGATAKTSHNLNSCPQLRKGLVTDVPGPMCNGCPGTLIPQEGLVSLLCAERRKMLCSSGGRCGRERAAEILSSLCKLFFFSLGVSGGDISLLLRRQRRPDSNVLSRDKGIDCDEQADC
ncbi:hypothetical protein BDD14_0771 [Edaphobacter modestus]|uniref:Uncharacterized protein n=1 Tax=Edaphobacter modestus TaxID=388466 RepID=A0A4Q7YR36_9BACT|nr:hypothetical protein BDD14_0771 [Edaphobacter modestus]